MNLPAKLFPSTLLRKECRLVAGRDLSAVVKRWRRNSAVMHVAFVVFIIVDVGRKRRCAETQPEFRPPKNQALQEPRGVGWFWMNVESWWYVIDSLKCLLRFWTTLIRQQEEHSFCFWWVEGQNATICFRNRKFSGATSLRGVGENSHHPMGCHLRACAWCSRGASQAGHTEIYNQKILLLQVTPGDMTTCAQLFIRLFSNRVGRKWARIFPLGVSKVYLMPFSGQVDFPCCAKTQSSLHVLKWIAYMCLEQSSFPQMTNIVALDAIISGSSIRTGRAFIDTHHIAICSRQLIFCPIVGLSLVEINKLVLCMAGKLLRTWKKYCVLTKAAFKTASSTCGRKAWGAVVHL